MARTLYARGDRLVLCGAVPLRIYRRIDGSVSIAPLPGYNPAVVAHNHYQVAPWVQAGVAGNFWLACGTTNSPAWIPFGGGERLRWLDPGGAVPHEVMEGGLPVYRPSQIFLWIADNILIDQDLHPGVTLGEVHDKLNQEIGPGLA